MSDSQKLARDLVSNLGKTLGIAALKLDEEGFCSVQFDTRYTVTIFADTAAEQLVLSTDLGPVAADHVQEICETMLRANYAWGETGGLGTLSLAPRDNRNESYRACMMHQAQVKYLDDARLQNLFEAFLNTSEAWVEYLAEFHRTAEPEPAGQPDWKEDSAALRV